MFHRLTITIFLIGLLFAVSTLHAATVLWQSSTSSAPWVAKPALTTTPWDNDNASYIGIDEKTTFQEIDGHGGCFNEMSWKAMLCLPQNVRDSVMKLLFDSAGGCNFNLCRMPIGMNDYSIDYYSLDDSVGDFAMNYFSIARDRRYIIPFVKAAMAIRPSLKVWGSPWTPPYWMKLNDGTMNQTSQYLTAYALYFAKAIKAYQQEGLRYYAICPQNEATWNGVGKTWSCKWNGEQMRDFIKNYLGPRFKNDDVNGEIWMGTINCDDGTYCSGPAGYVPISPIVLADTLANACLTGVGYQYSPTKIGWCRQNYPYLRLMQTETPCGTMPSNFWTYAEGNDGDMQTYFRNGANSFMQWNIVLDTSGANLRTPTPWRQFSMIQIDTGAKKVIYTPQFYQVRHYGYVKQGAYRVATSGTFLSVLAFRNPDGENVLIATNALNSNVTVAINFNGQKIKPTLPAHSFNSFRTAGTPIPAISPFSRIEAEKFTLQSGTFIMPCSEGGSRISLVHNNDWVAYDNIDFGNGAGSFSARVAAMVGGTIEIHLDSCNGPASGTCTVVPTGGMTTWSTVSCALSGVSGKHTFYLKFKGAGANNLFDLNWIVFSPATTVSRAAMQSALTGNIPRIIICNGSTLPVSFAAGNKPGTIAVYNLSGKLVYSAQIGGNSKGRTTDPGLKRGIYLIKLRKL